MNKTTIDYNMDFFNQENIELMLTKLGFNTNNYIWGITKSSMLNRALIENIVDFANRYCIICFSETELNLIMLSRINNKKVTEIIKIPRNEIINIKLSNILISYMLKIKLNGTNLNFQIFKKVASFTNIKNSIDLFKKIYNL